MARRRRPWYGWPAERNAWTMCKDMCHESQRFCWYPLERIYVLIKGYRPPRTVRYAPSFYSSALALNDQYREE